MDTFQQLLTFFKAMSNESRLMMVALLSENDYTVRELARRLHLKEPTVSEHLSLLKEAELVTVRSEGNYRIYSFNRERLLDLSQQLQNPDTLESLVPAEETDEDRILQNYLDENERLKVIPGSRKKLMIVLRWLANKFEMGQQYPEKEVNAIILKHHEDYATLRREMIGTGLMQREKGIYWRLS